MLSPLVGRCRYCQKIMRDRPIIGSLHVCLTPGERRVIDLREADTSYRAIMQAQVVNGSYQLRP